MSRPAFAEKWQASAAQSRLAIGIAPRVADLPAPIARYDDPFLPFGRALIEALAEFAGAFVFDLASYLALGAAGARALERSIPLVPRHLPTILHAPFYTADFAPAAFEEAFAVDAVTLANVEALPAYTAQPQHGAFLLAPLPLPPAPNAGSYKAQVLQLAPTAAFRWVTREIIYASGRDDYLEQARQEAARWQQRSLSSPASHP